MKRSTTKKRVLSVLLVFALNIILGLGMMAFAQSDSNRESQSVSITTEDDGRVKLKITTKKGDNQEVFEKEYESFSDMEDDPELEKYELDFHSFGRKGGFAFRSGSGKTVLHSGPGLHLFNFDDEDGPMMMFDFDGDSIRAQIHEMMEDLHSFHFDNNGHTFWMNDKKLLDLDSLRDEFRERFEDMDFDFDFDDWGDHSKAFVWKHSDDEDDDHFRVIRRSKVTIKPASEEDRKRVGADKMKALEIRDISFYPNPNDGKFEVSIKSGNKGPIRLKIVNEEGKEVYNQSKSENASGGYTFDVDLSDEKSGKYLLTAEQNKKTLVKRINKR